ncbi:MAG: DUF2461 domain-containing protein [Chitinophagaceae bacterium]|nr:DUF2461 domain-containing protein [Chitinophagaceae bacterium]
MLQPDTLQFLAELKENNNKAWFDTNRPRFENAKQDLLALVESLIKKLGKTDADIAVLAAKDCVFRQNRDVRFSKNKSPYKINMGTYLNRGGKKSPLAGYYFHCEPGDKSFVGGGIWMPEAPALKKVRQEIDYSFDEFKKILAKKTFVNQYGDLNIKEHTLSREPKGYEKENPAIKYLKLKSFVALRPLTDNDLTGNDLEKKIVTAFDALQPLIHFLNRSMAE